MIGCVCWPDTRGVCPEGCSGAGSAAVADAVPVPVGDKLNRCNATTGQYAQACVQVARECGTDVLDLWTLMQKNQVRWKSEIFETVTNCEIASFSMEEPVVLHYH